MEHDDTREPVAKEVRLLVPIAKSEAALKRISYGVVLEPDTEDLQGDVMTAEDIEAAAYDWMERSQRGGHMHADTVAGAKVVESYIAPCDIPVETAGGPETIRKGSWVLAMRWPQEIWESIAKGDLTGYSVGGTGVRLALEEIGKKGKWVPGPNAGWRMANGDPARDGAAAEGGGTPADRGAAAAWEDDRRRKPKTYHSDEAGEVTVPEDDDSPARVEDEERDEELRQARARAPHEEAAYRAGATDAREGGLAGLSDDEIKARVKANSHSGRPVSDAEAQAYVEGVHSVRDENMRISREASARQSWVWDDGGEEDSKADGYPSGTVDDEERYPTGGKWAGEDNAEDHDFDIEAHYPKFDRGQKVRDTYGKEHRVLEQRGSQVFFADGGWAHPTKVFPVKKSLTDVVREAFEDVAKAGKWAPGPNAGWRRLDDDLTGHGSDRSTPRLDAWHRSQTASMPEERGQAAAEYERLADEEEAAETRTTGRGVVIDAKHTTRDGVVIEDQPKVQRVRGSEMYATADGSVQLDFSRWKWTGGGGGPRGVAKNPPLHQRGTWAAWPRGADEDDINQVKIGYNKTLAEFIASLEPGEYKLGT